MIPADITIPLLRTIIGGCCVVKAILEYRWNYLNIYSSGSFLRYLHSRSGWELPDSFYRLVVHSRFLSSILFAVGISPHLSGAILTLALFFEVRFNFKFHTQFLLFCVLFWRRVKALKNTPYGILTLAFSRISLLWVESFSLLLQCTLLPLFRRLDRRISFRVARFAETLDLFIANATVPTICIQSIHLH